MTATRRFVAAVATSALALTGVGIAFAAGEGGGLGLPSDGCDTYPDAKGDAFTLKGPVGTAPVPTPADPDLDITGVVMGVTPTAVSAYIRVSDLIGAPNYSTGETWRANFTALGKTVVVSGTRDETGIDGVIKATGEFESENFTTVAGAADYSIATTAVFDQAKNLVILSADRVALEKSLGGALAGQSLSLMSATSRERYVLVNTATVDTATAPTGAVFAVGTNPCFGAATTPTTSAPASASPSPTATTTPSPTASPTGSPTPTPEPTEEPTEEPGDGEEEEGDGLLAAPREGCFLFKDAAGDADPLLGQDDDLDITEVAVKSTDEALSIYASIADLSSAPFTPVFNGHSFAASFTIGDKPVTVSASGTGPATSDPDTIDAAAEFDEEANRVVLVLPKADLEAVTEAPIPAGTPIKDLTLTSEALSLIGSSPADTAAGATPAEKTYAYGNNTCFMPPAGKLVVGGAKSGVFTDRATVTATLTDAADEAVGDAKVKLAIAGLPAREATTNDDGRAVFTFPVTAPAGVKALTATFTGNATVGATSVAKSFTVLQETTVLKAVGGAGKVTATLTDNDRTPVAGRVVAFTVGKTVTKVKTSTKGVAVLTKQRRGTIVKVSFAAVPRLYKAAPTVSAKVL